ncbi:MAG: Ig-like domain-containing protein, partial [Methanosarcinales archaeon]
DYLLVNASNKVGLSKVGLKAKDGVLDSNIEEINILVEDENESKLKNNEVTNTTVKLLSKVQYYNGSYLEEEYSKESYIKVLPGSINQLDLSKLFEWDSSKSSHIRGKFRVYFSAVDDNNITLVNRDGTNISAYYNFTLIYINTPPNLTGIPDKYVLINQKPDLINLFDYTKDKEQDLDSLNYSIVNQSNSSLINCSISNWHYINCSKPENTGISEINVSVFDGLLYDYDVFNIRVLPYSFLRKQNLTYTFLSSDFNLTGDPNSGYRRVLVGNDTVPGSYIVTVIVSDGAINITQKVILKVKGRETEPPILEFVPPTPDNNSIINTNYAFINITASENLSTAKLEWKGVNETMQGSGSNWHINKTDLISGNYSFRVYGKDNSGNWNSTEKREITIKLPETRPPIPKIIEPKEGEIVINNIKVKATTTDTDIAYTIFEYSVDNSTWLEIGNDTNGIDGWGVIWNTTQVQDGTYYIRAIMTDKGGLTGRDTISVKVSNELPQNPSGGIGVSVIPEMSYTTAGSNLSLDIKIVSTENFEDVFKVNITLDNIIQGYQANLSWFNWTYQKISITSGGEKIIPIGVSIPSNATSGYKLFRVQVNSTKWIPTAYETGFIILS